jgi:hypothetical protein
MTKPIVSRERLASETDQLRQAVNAHRAQKPAAAPLQSTKPAKRRPPPAERPTSIDGYPFNDSPPAAIPDFRTMETAQIVVRARQRKVGAQLPAKPFGPPELRKRSRQ